MRYHAFALGLAVTIAATLPVSASELPPMGYFAGSYEAVGRMPGTDVETFSRSLTIAAETDRLLLDLDGVGAGFLEVRREGPEGAAPYAGRLAEFWIDCLFQNDPDNYPILTCKFWDRDRSGEGVVTYWPAP